jgi:UDP-N-acetyl-2-amino-2-deoxyglucuronate dehydrogenase
MDATFSLIGCGRIGERHAELMNRYGKLISVCDVVRERADLFSEKFAAKAFYQVTRFIENLQKSDVVAVCTPNGLHAEHCIQILESGMHVLCEKPMAITTEDCRSMISVSKKTGKSIFLVKQNRFNPPVMELKKLMDEGRLGKIYSLQLNCFWNRNADYYLNSWKGTKAMDGGTLFTQFSHFIDLLYWFIGDVAEVKSILTNYAHNEIIEFEDTGMVVMKFKNGVTGTLNYTVNSYGKNMEGSITIFGEKGTVKVGGQYLNKIEYQNIENHKIENISESNSANEYGNYQGSMSNHEKIYENIINFLQGREAMYINSEDGMKTVEIIEKIYKSAGKSDSTL